MESQLMEVNQLKLILFLRMVALKVKEKLLLKVETDQVPPRKIQQMESTIH